MFKLEKETFEKIAKAHNVQLSDNYQEILNAKQELGIGIKCPCSPWNKEMYCGSKFCMNEVRTKNSCHCGLFIKK